MVRPTKAIGPQAAVAAPQSSTTAAAETTRESGDVGAEAAGHVLAERERVEHPAEEQGEQRADDQERRDLRDDGEVAAGERADLPEPELVEGRLVHQQEGRW